MTATPAQVANDLAAQGRWWDKRDRDVAHACEDGARLIRRLMAGEHVDGRTFYGIKGRMERLEQAYAKRQVVNNPSHSLWRGLRRIEELSRASAGAKP
jgi:hypothetical protein